MRIKDNISDKLSAVQLTCQRKLMEENPQFGYYSVFTTRSLLIAEKMSTLGVNESMKEYGGITL